jgi:hypothetical protein
MKVAEEEHVGLKDKAAKRARETLERNAKVLKLYREGESVSVIATRIGVSADVVSRALIDHGIPRPHRSRRLEQA